MRQRGEIKPFQVGLGYIEVEKVGGKNLRI